ncbi:DUF3791 domain-containing protein [uncultured Bacteroides sp.]|uniref:DUF3791 domain-containing protein n=1 Tax=uncultured Bacteroides sp. TaxID=162156 RepID=UPI00280BD9D0|nr:DUF3791 domain-containing protein [uncultured Bacteroides sp.]
MGAFTEKYSLSNNQAYKYLKRFAGLDFLEEMIKVILKSSNLTDIPIFHRMG